MEQFDSDQPILVLGGDRGSPKNNNEEHVKLLNEIYKKQRQRDGLFVHEQAQRSKLKDSQYIQELIYEPNVHTTTPCFHVSTFLTNSPLIIETMEDNKLWMSTKDEVDKAIVDGLQRELSHVAEVALIHAFRSILAWRFGNVVPLPLLF